MTYSEKLKDPRWQRKRLEVMQRDEFTCQECETKTETLHVHHKFYLAGKEPWDYELGALITLCWSCHEAEEISKLDFKSTVQDVLSSGFSYDQLTILMNSLIRPVNISKKDRIMVGATILFDEELLQGLLDQILKNRNASLDHLDF